MLFRSQGCGDSPRPCANDRSQVLHGHALLRAALRASPRKKIAPTFGRHYPPATSSSRGAVRQQGACRGIVINSNANLATGAPTIDAQRISTSEDLLMPRAGSTRVPSLSTLCSEETSHRWSGRRARPSSRAKPDRSGPRVCRFYGRCPEGFERCRHKMPVLRSVGHGPHAVACHRLEGERLERSVGG